MSTNSVNRIIKFCYLIPFFFLIKPDYFSYLGAFSSIYKLGFILFFALIVCKEFFLIKKRKSISKITLLVILIIIYPFIVSVFYGVEINQAIYIPLIQTLGIALLLEIGVQERFNECLSALALLLEIYIYINFLSIILFPNGLYNADFYSGNYWFLGYKNVMIRFILPGVCINFISAVCRKEKHTFRICILCAIAIASLIMVDNKTGIIGLAIIIISAILFSKKKLPRFINLRNTLIIIGIISVLLGTTSLLSEFSPILKSMGETVSVMSRQAVWFRAIQMFMKNPLFGYGLRSGDQYRKLINLSTGWGYFSHPHNYILFTLIQGGIIVVLLIVVLFICLSRTYIEHQNNYGCKMLIFMYLGFFVMGITESLTGATLLYPLAILMDGMKNRKIEYNFRIKNKKVILKWGG